MAAPVRSPAATWVALGPTERGLHNDRRATVAVNHHPSLPGEEALGGPWVIGTKILVR